jgi:hypothetical protein
MRLDPARFPEVGSSDHLFQRQAADTIIANFFSPLLDRVRGIEALHEDWRDRGTIAQMQIDTAQDAAMDELLQDFEKYRVSHQSAWDLMARTGSLHAGPAAPSDTPKT